MIATTTCSQDAKAFLDRFPINRRSFVSGIFHGVVRQGATSVGRILLGVLQDARSRSEERGIEPERLALLKTLMDAIRDDPGPAGIYAQRVLDWERLPTEERHRLKSMRSEHHQQEWMRSQPPTSAQLAYLRALGHEGVVSDRATASHVIGNLLAEPARRERS